MGYFSNGTEGLDFEETYCRHCVNMPEREDRGCPVWLTHLLYAYDLCNEEKHPGKVMLDILIERDARGSQRCMMFIDKRKKRLRTVPDAEKDAELAKARPKLVEWEPKP
jgi:hypothetical protein